jgi:hypothetical protein
MKLQQYLIEDNKIEIIHRGITAVYDNCMPFIKDLVKGGFDNTHRQDDLLYSGRNKTIPMFSSEIRKNRRPKDMQPFRHDTYDRLFNDKFGVKVRSNSLFCTGNYTEALSYGSGLAYLIFPIGQYKVIWSDKVRDLYTDYIANKVFEKYPSMIDPTPPSREEIKKLDQELNKMIISTYHDGKLMGAIRSGHEIMLSGKGYIGLDYDLFSNQLKFYITNFKTKKPTPEILNQLTDLWPI